MSHKQLKWNYASFSLTKQGVHFTTLKCKLCYGNGGESEPSSVPSLLFVIAGWDSIFDLIFDPSTILSKSKQDKGFKLIFNCFEVMFKSLRSDVKRFSGKKADMPSLSLTYLTEKHFRIDKVWFTWTRRRSTSWCPRLSLDRKLNCDERESQWRHWTLQSRPSFRTLSTWINKHI